MFKHEHNLINTTASTCVQCGKYFRFGSQYQEHIKLKGDKSSPIYWLFAPGKNAEKWTEFQEKNIMALGWGIGDLSKYPGSI